MPVHELLASSDVISLHCPLTEETHHIVDAGSLAHIKRGAILVNTSLFFQDLSSTIITDDLIQRLVSFPNLIVTGHQAFFTVEAIGQIMASTVDSISAFERGDPLVNRIPAP